MATPAAVLSILVKADGVRATTAQLTSLEAATKKANTTSSKLWQDSGGKWRNAAGQYASSTEKAAAGVDELSKKNTKSGKSFAAIGKAAKFAGGLAGIGGLAITIKATVGEFQEAQKVGAQTNAVLKSTGGVANVTKKGVENLAGAISKKAGIDDEAIQKGANLLLTFKNIRNETGRGRDIFNQATQAATDLSVAGFGSLESTSKQLGKALNDPIKGMTALGRSGVTFSADQKKAIEALLATGKAADRVKAQQIILREVQSQVGGSAAAQATAMDKMKVAFGNLAEAAGSILVPVLEVVMRALTSLINQFIEGEGIARFIIPAFLAVGNAVAAVVGFFRQHTTTAIALAAAIGTLAAAYVAMQVISGISAMIHVFNGLLIAQRAGLLGVTLAQYGLNTAMLANPFVLVALAIAVLVAAIVVMIRHWDEVKAVLSVVWAWMKQAATDTFGWVKNAVVNSWNAIRSATSAVWGAIQSILNAIWGGIRAAVTTYFNAYKTIILGVWSAVQTATAAVWTAIRTAAVLAWEGLRIVAGTFWEGIRVAILTPLRSARDAISDIWHSIGTRAASAWENLQKGVTTFAGNMKDSIVNAFEGAANKVLDFVNAIIGVINKIPGVDIKKIEKLELAKGGVHGKGRAAQALARGGVVNKPIVMMGEEAPRHPEYVIPTNPAYRGRAQMLLGQAAGAIGYAEGGVVGAFNSAIGKANAGPKASLALFMAGIVESGLRNLPDGHLDSRGALQIRDSTAGPMGINNMDPFASAMAFLTRGFWGKGSAISLAARNPTATAGWVAQNTQGSDFPERYDLVRSQALAAMGGKAGGGGGGGIIGAIGGIVGDLLSKGAGFLLNQLPGIGDLPGWLHGTGKFVLDKVSAWIKDKVKGLVDSGGGQGGPGVMTGTAAKAAKLAKKFNATITSGYRTPAQNAAANGAAGSSHMKGSPSNPGAHDFVPAQTALLQEALRMGAKWVDNHDFGSGLHSHVSWFRKGGVLGAPFVGSYAQGGVVPRDGFAQVHAGETITAAGERGPLMHVEQLNVYEPMDFERELRKLAWAVETA